MPVRIRAAVVDRAPSPIPQLLRASGIIDVVGVAQTLRELRRHLPTWEPEVLCLNMNLIKSLPALIAYISHYHRQTRCVIARHDEDAVAMAHYLRQGAIGYTLEHDGADSATIVSHAASRTAWIDADVATVIKATLHQVARQRRVASILPPNEQVILDLIASGTSCQAIAQRDAAWNEHAVLAHIYNLLIHYQQTL